MIRSFVLGLVLGMLTRVQLSAPGARLWQDRWCRIVCLSAFLGHLLASSLRNWHLLCGLVWQPFLCPCYSSCLTLRNKAQRYLGILGPLRHSVVHRLTWKGCCSHGICVLNSDDWDGRDDLLISPLELVKWKLEDIS